MRNGMLKWFNSIRIKIPAVIVIIIIIPVIIFWQYYYNSLISNVTDNTKVVVESGLSNLSLSIEYTLNKITGFSSNLVNNQDFLRLLENYINAPEANKKLERSRLTLDLNQRLLSNDLMDSAFIVFDDKSNILTTVFDCKEIPVNSDTGNKIFRQYMDLKPSSVAWYTAPNYLKNGTMTLSYKRPVKITGKPDMGISLICNMDNDVLSTMVKSLDFDKSFVVVSDYNGLVMLSSENRYLGLNMDKDSTLKAIKGKENKSSSFIADIDGREYLVIRKVSMQTSWNYIEAVPMDVLYGGLKNQLYMIYLLAITSVIVSIIGALLITRYVVSPINRLVLGFKHMEAGELNTLQNVKRNDELGILLRGYNTMVQKLKNMIDELYVKELLRKEAQIRSIQSQLNEHFLYNVLNSIYCIAKKEKAEHSAEMIGVLSRFFRLTLSEGHEFVTVRDAVQLIKYYIWIQKARYDRLNCEITVDPDIMDKYVLKYIFQPIVENAVLHGIESKQGEGTILISFEIFEGLLLFKVRDDGVGMTVEKIEELYRVFNQHNRVKGDNFALININAQIKIVYGEEYGISISSEPDQGTEVGFLIPLREKRGEEDE